MGSMLARNKGSTHSETNDLISGNGVRTTPAGGQTKRYILCARECPRVNAHANLTDATFSSAGDLTEKVSASATTPSGCADQAMSEEYPSRERQIIRLELLP